MVNSASGRYRLDPDLVNSVIKAESGFNARAVSPKGAQGLMQLMPGTASQLGVPNAFDPQANVEGGTKYLRELLERYNFDLVKALAAYNAGPQRVEQFGGVPPYYETRAYVARIVRDFNKKKAAQQKEPQARSRNPNAVPSEAPARSIPASSRRAQNSDSRSGESGCTATPSQRISFLRTPLTTAFFDCSWFDPSVSVIYLGTAVSRFALRGAARSLSPSWIRSAFWPAWSCS